MFIGGLSWQTAPGKFVFLHLSDLPGARTSIGSIYHALARKWTLAWSIILVALTA